MRVGDLLLVQTSILYDWVILIAESSSSGVVKLLACRARVLGFDSRSRHLNFRVWDLLLPSSYMTERFLMKFLKSTKPKLGSLALALNARVPVAWVPSSRSKFRNCSTICRHYIHVHVAKKWQLSFQLQSWSWQLKHLMRARDLLLVQTSILYDWVILITESSSSGVVKLLSCRARVLGFDSLSRHLNFRIWDLLLPSRYMTERFLMQILKSTKPKLGSF